MSNTRKYASPRFVISRRRCFSPLECCLGTSPNPAANWRSFRNIFPSATPGLVTEGANHSCPIVRASGCFQANDASWNASEKVRYLTSPQPLFQNCPTACICSVYLENVLGCIQTNHLQGHSMAPPQPSDFNCSQGAGSIPSGQGHRGCGAQPSVPI